MKKVGEISFSPISPAGLVAEYFNVKYYVFSFSQLCSI